MKTFNLVNKPHIIVQVIYKGDRYALDNRIHQDVDPLVEFYCKHNPTNYFISRYYLSTLLETNEKAEGICLEGSDRRFDLEAAELSAVIKAIGTSRPERKKVTCHFYRGKGDRKRFLYGKLIDESGSICVSASANYVLRVIPTDGYEILNQDDMFKQLADLMLETKQGFA